MTKAKANICILHPTLPDDQLWLIRDIAEVLEGTGHTARPLEANGSVNGGLLAQLQAAHSLSMKPETFKLSKIPADTSNKFFIF